MPAQLIFDVASDAGRLVLVAAGEIDLSNISAFKQALTDAAAEATRTGAPLTVDLARVGYLDSAAINVLSAGADEIHKLIVHPLLMTTFTVSGLTELIAIEAASA